MGRIEKEFDDLRYELRHHPEILAKADQAKNIYQFLEIVATECNVLVEGAYSSERILGLAEYLTNKLYKSRTSLIIVKGNGNGNYTQD